MTEIWLTAAFLGMLFFFLGTGVWVGISLIGVSAVGMTFFTTRPVGDAMATIVWGASSSWTLTALPLFIWMGDILFRTKLSENLFRGLAPWMSRLPGGLLHVNVAGCAIFAAISGSSAATVATVGKMSIPELRQRNYPERTIVGTLAGAGTLGLLIPPSIILIIYGVTVNESIAQLFIAGVLPGIMFMGYIAVWGIATRNAGAKEESRPTMADRIRSIGLLLPVVLLITAVIGSIYTGIATATEAAVFGVVGALILWQAPGSCRLPWALPALPRALATTIAAMDLSPIMLIVALTIFYIILGCFLYGISAVVLTMAVIEPLVRTTGFDMIWFGIYLVIVVEMAQITPPIGFNLFVLQGMTGKDMDFIARAVIPMFGIMVLAVALLVLVPDVATWLPSQMSTR